jgi:signal transduction histidine kinase
LILPNAVAFGSGDERQGWPARRPLVDMALVLVVYAVLAYLAIAVARQPGTIATVWLANGAAIALIASAPWRRMWPLLAAAVAGNLLANLSSGDGLVRAVAFLPAGALEILLGVYLVERNGRADQFASDAGSFVRVLLAGAVIPPVLGAIVGAATSHALGLAPITRVWLDWYIGAALGATAMLPLVLALRSLDWPMALRQLADARRWMVVALVTAATAVSFRYSPYPFVVVIAGLMVVAFVRPRIESFLCAPGVVMVLAVLLALGYFKPLGTDTPLGHAAVYFSAMLMVIPAQVAAVVVARQRSLSQTLAAVGARDDEIIVLTDMGGVYRWVNKTRESYWGVPNSDVLGKTFQEVPVTRRYTSVVAPMVSAANAGQSARELAEIDFPVRGRRMMEFHMQPALDEEGQQIGVLGRAVDVTELEASRRQPQQLADELLASNRNLEQFVRVSSHDLREPLNTVVQFCQLIDEGSVKALDAEGQLYFAQVREGAARMRGMLDDVLQFVRLDAAAGPSPRRVSLDAVVGEVLTDLQSQIKNSQAEVSHAGLGDATGHPALLRLVLQNLVSNAIKFVPDGRAPRVTITSRRHAGELAIGVADNGIGIDATHLSELGTPFRRLHARRKFEGTGLGLAICKRIAEQHGGRIEIESTLGSGSCFSLMIPES